MTLPRLNGPLPAFLLLYGGLYSAYGTQSAYLPAFLESHGLPVERVGLVLAAATLVKIVAGPGLGRLADRRRAGRRVLALCAIASGGIGFAYGVAYGFVALLATALAQAAATAATAPLADALATGAARGEGGFEYGWVRGAGSASFVAGTLLSGQLIRLFGLGSIVLSSSILFAATALPVRLVPETASEVPQAAAPEGSFGEVLRVRVYRRLLVVAALVIGSHAVNDGFAVIEWQRAGYGSGAISLFWSESVAAEIVVFFLLGPWLLERLGPGRAMVLSSVAGILRWSVLGSTMAMPALLGVQALHGLTFALLHLAAMSVITAAVPARLAGTAQTLYGTFALGIATAFLTFAAGYLFGALGSGAFYVMAALCLIATPLALHLTVPDERPVRAG